MEKFTIEEKAKAYDEAVINGSRLWECGAITKENYEYIFPELAESEESSAFKDKLLELFQKFRYIKESVPTNGDIIDYVDAHIQELIDTIQKPTEWSDEDYVMQRAALEILMASPKTVASTILKESVIVWLKSLKDRVQPQSKQEWSEEDEYAIRWIRTICNDFVKSYKISPASTKVVQERVDKIESWLNTIKDRVGCEAICTTTREWNEEDEKMKDAIYSCVDSHYDGLAKTSLLIWLKSLRPQTTWKPSDEQLDSLYDVLNPCDGFNREVLESLYVQLKKLREE